MERGQALRQARDRKLSVWMDKTKCVCGQWWREHADGWRRPWFPSL